MFGLDKIVSGGIVGAAEGVANIIDKFVETPEEAAAADLLKSKLLLKPGLAQVELNKIEAGHRSIWVAGWRPAIGWVCATGLFFFFVPQYILASYLWVIQVIEMGHIVPYPSSADGLLSLVMALLGMGALRTVEKLNGRAK